MSIPRITGQQARDLLRGTTPGPWEPEFEVGIYPSLRLDADDEIDWACAADRDLAIASPSLAVTVAWLYGREPDGHDPHRGPEWNVWPKVGFTTEGDIAITSERSGTGFTMPKLAAIELARALLAAAEEPRDDTA